MDSAWYIVTATVTARGQKKKGDFDTAASHKAFRGKKSLKAKGSGWIWINNYPILNAKNLKLGSSNLYPADVAGVTAVTMLEIRLKASQT